MIIPMYDLVTFVKVGQRDEWGVEVPGQEISTHCFLNLKGGLDIDTDGTKSGTFGGTNKQGQLLNYSGHVYISYRNDISHNDKIRFMDVLGQVHERRIKEIIPLKTFGLGKKPLLMKVTF